CCLGMIRSAAIPASTKSLSRLPQNSRSSSNHAVVTVLRSSRGRNGFEDLVENDEKFSHDGSQGEFVRFAFGAQTLVKRREDMITTSRGQRCHVEAAAQSATAAKDGALAT